MHGVSFVVAGLRPRHSPINAHRHSDCAVAGAVAGMETGPSFVYAAHVLVLGGGNPLRSRKLEPLSEGKGVTARWGLKEAGATVTTRRTETGYLGLRRRVS